MRSEGSARLSSDWGMLKIARYRVLPKRTLVRSVQFKAELRDEGCAAPAGRKALGICQWIGLSARRRVGVSGKDKAIFFREICVVVAQIQAEDLPLECDPRVPVEIGRKRKAAQCRRLIAEPVVADTCRHGAGNALR